MNIGSRLGILHAIALANMTPASTVRKIHKGVSRCNCGRKLWSASEEDSGKCATCQKK